MISILQDTTALWLISLLSCYSLAYELQDTIHTLKEENFHLQHRLENLTQAVRDLKHLLTEHSKVSGGQHDADFLHDWREWSHHGISAETHQMLEQVFCITEFHDAAHSIFITQRFFFFLILVFTIHTLLL